MDQAIQLWGAGAFGAIIGWYVYYINRYRKSDVQLTDLVTLIGVIGGAAILTLFPQGTSLFGAYGIGLAAGFFLYFVMLIIFVGMSQGIFSSSWFLDGRRRKPRDDEWIPELGGPGGRPMDETMGGSGRQGVPTDVRARAMLEDAVQGEVSRQLEAPINRLVRDEVSRQLGPIEEGLRREVARLERQASREQAGGDSGS